MVIIIKTKQKTNKIKQNNCSFSKQRKHKFHLKTKTNNKNHSSCLNNNNNKIHDVETLKKRTTTM